MSLCGPLYEHLIFCFGHLGFLRGGGVESFCGNYESLFKHFNALCNYIASILVILSVSLSSFASLASLF